MATKKKATTKKAIVKKATAKKAITKRATVVKKTSPSKRTTNRRPKKQVKLVIPKKMSNFLKPVGIFIAISGALGLIALVSIGLISVFTPSANDEPVLGVSIGSRPSVATPKNVKTSVTKQGISVSWTSANVDSYTIYRKLGLFGSKVAIATTNRPTEYKDGVASVLPESSTRWPMGHYVDTAVSKNTFVTYYIVATKNHVSSGMAAGRRTWNNKAYAAKNTFTVYSNTAKSISINAYIDTKSTYNVKLTCNDDSQYCNSLIGARYLLPIDTKSGSRPYLSYRENLLNIGQKGDHYVFQLTGLKAGTKYSVEISSVEATGFGGSNSKDGNVYDTVLGGARSITTAKPVVAPDAVSNFQYDGMTETSNGGVRGAFKWAYPIKPVDGYKMSLSCETNRPYLQSGQFSIPMTWSADIGGIHDDSNDVTFTSDSSSLKLGIGHYVDELVAGLGLCTATITPYNLNAGYMKILGPVATVTFGSVTSKPQTIPDTPSGLLYNGQYNSGEVVWLRTDIPNSAPEGYSVDVSCVKSGATTDLLTDYIPSVSYIYDSDDFVHGIYLELNLDQFGVGHGACTAKVKAFNYNYEGSKNFGEYSTVTFNN